MWSPYSILLWQSALAATVTLPTGDGLAKPELAQAIAQQTVAMFDRIDDLQCRFHSTMKPIDPKGADLARSWDNGLYAYKRGGYELMSYEETAGQHDPVLWTYVVTPETVRGWRDNPQSGRRAGASKQAVRLNFRLQWAPSHHLPLSFIERDIGRFLRTGNYVVRLPRGEKGDPELIAPVRESGSADNSQSKATSQVIYVLTLSRQRGMSPVKIERYLDELKQLETILDVVEIAPHVWLAEHGVCEQLAGGKGVFAKGVRSEFWLEPGSVRLNSGLDVAFFNADFPPGTRVTDQIAKTRFVAGQSAQGRGAALKAASARAAELAPVKAAGEEPVVLFDAGWAPIDWIVAGCGVLVLVTIVLAVFAFVKKTWTKEALESRF